MFRKLMTGMTSLALVMAIGATAMVQKAEAGPRCYKTGPNTVQCIDR